MENFRRKYIPILAFLTGTVFMYIGIVLKQENLTVLHKAIRICMECIGIG